MKTALFIITLISIGVNNINAQDPDAENNSNNEELASKICS
ncbi:hypothetical protein [Algibacter lectus]|uniref:Uncharacterized protein n=1 Tax=Algibacter lectus TaxID=221126 RepID=A0A090W6W8_9FLAO|nr:hypothetical protein [Algibacter lectus]GAL63272.1 hypothetical protein JCM19300_1294 [Algibacter lectus]